MNVQLLLLLALVGPFCAFTHASPTGIPAEFHTSKIPEMYYAEEEAEATEEDLHVVTGPPPTLPGVAPVEVTAEALPDEVTNPAFAVHTVFETEVVTAAAEAAESLATEAPVPEETTETETEDHTTAAEVQPEVTTAPEVQPEVTAAPEVQPEVTAAAEVLPEVTAAAEVLPELTAASNAEMGQDEDVVVENGADGELSSGQVVGIVIGALLAVVIVIAVVIAAVRRMGKYSP